MHPKKPSCDAVHPRPLVMSKSLLLLEPGPYRDLLLRWSRDAGIEAVAPTSGDEDQLMARALDLAVTSELLGVFTCTPEAQWTAARIEAAAGGSIRRPGALDAVELALAPGRETERTARLAALGLASHDATGERFEVNAFFRPDGAFVEGGLAWLVRDDSGLRAFCIVPGGLRRDEERAAYRLVEEAARALGIAAGPVSAELVFADRSGTASPGLVELTPGFRDEALIFHVTPLLHGRSPVQAWLAACVDAGGPFDTLPAPAEGEEQVVGWMAVRCLHPGPLLEVSGLDRARLVPGIEGARLIRRPGEVLGERDKERSLVGYVWARGYDADEVEARLCDAVERITVRVGERVVA